MLVNVYFDNMAIKNTMTSYDFINSWPESRKDNFSREGLLALYEYLDNLSDELGEDIEYDPVAFCCDFSEYESALEVAEYYNEEIEGEDEEEKEENALEWLQDHTTVIEFDGGVIIQDF